MFGKSFKYIRKEYVGITQEEAAYSLGRPKRTIENWEGGVNEPSSAIRKDILNKVFGLKKLDKSTKYFLDLLDMYDTTKINFGLYVYPKLDAEGGLRSYKVLVMQKMPGIFIQFRSGYSQSLLEILDLETLLRIYRDTNDCVHDSYLNSTFGTDDLDDVSDANPLWDTFPSNWQIKAESIPVFVSNVQEIFKTKILKHMKENNIDNCFYGNCGKSGGSPVDKGHVAVDTEKDVLFDIKY